MKKMETEILIIGAGASGLAAAWNLSKSRFKIYCFDQGAIINNKIPSIYFNIVFFMCLLYHNIQFKSSFFQSIYGV